MEIIKGIVPTPWRIIVYGTPGIGKSTLGTFAPKPLMVDLENGLNRIDAEKTPLIKDWAGLMEAVKFFAGSDYKTAVFDTLDALEQILTRKILDEYNAGQDENKHRTTLADWPYGHGFELLLANWSLFLKATERLMALGKNVLIIGHEQIQKFEDPSSDTYDRYALKCHKKSAGLLVAAMDAVLFAKYEVILKARPGGFSAKGDEKKRAVGDGTAIIHTTETANWIAKNRFNLPKHLPMNAELFSQIN